jgi:alpha-tubulin suppressor-like RCC1 family protein
VLLAAAMLAAALVAGPSQVGAAPAVPLSTGSNAFGQLGDAAVATRRTSPAPVDVPQLVAVASGRDHAYGLDADGRIWAWGENGYGQVGDGTTTDRRTPVRLALTGVVAIEAGHYHGVAVRSDGTVWVWGYGALGQLGLGTTSNRTTPTQVPGLSGISQVAAGRDMTYAVRADRHVVAWGSNALGEVGDGTTTRRLSPVDVPGLTEVVEISGGRNHALARRSDGSVWVWGDNRYGQLGDGSTATRLSPVRISLASAAHVDAGAHHSIGVRTDGTVLTWGRGYRGQLGLGTTSNRTSPTVVPGVPDAVEVGDGRDQSFAITAAGDVWAWGQNSDGQLGDGTTTTRNSPVRLAISGIIAAQSGSAHTVFLPGEPGQTTTTTTSSSTTTTTTSSTTSSTTTSSTTTSTTSTSTTSTSTTTSTTVPPSGQVGFRGAATATVNATSAAVAVPATVVGGDQLLLFVTTNSVPTYGAPAGWTLVGQQVHTSSSDMLTRLYRRTAAPGDAGAQVRVTMPTTTKVDLVLVAYSGVDPVDPLAQWAVRQETATTTAHMSPPLSSPAVGGWVVSYWAEKTSTTTDWLPPSGQVSRTETSGSGSGRIESLLVDSGGEVGAGQWSALTATADTAGRKVIAFSVSLRPAP